MRKVHEECGMNDISYRNRILTSYHKMTNQIPIPKFEIGFINHEINTFDLLASSMHDG